MRRTALPNMRRSPSPKWGIQARCVGGCEISYNAIGRYLTVVGRPLRRQALDDSFNLTRRRHWTDKSTANVAAVAANHPRASIWLGTRDSCSSLLLHGS